MKIPSKESFGQDAETIVDRANQTKAEQKLSSFGALIEAGNTMTTVAMVFGMSPIAIGGAAGSEWKSGLAWALIAD